MINLQSIPDKLRGVDIDSKCGFGTSKSCYQGYKVDLNVVFDKDYKQICYQLIVLFNLKTHRKMGAVKEIMELI